MVSGPIRSLKSEKSFSGDNPIIQRIYQLVVDGGELHKPTQELVDLLEGLDDKPTSRQVGFRFGDNK